VNDLELARLVLPNPHVRWAQPTGAALAAALSAVVSLSDPASVAAAAAASVTGRSWEPTQEALVGIIEEEVFSQAGRTGRSNPPEDDR
jgi:O-antigen biosynthesis protein